MKNQKGKGTRLKVKRKPAEPQPTEPKEPEEPEEVLEPEEPEESEAPKKPEATKVESPGPAITMHTTVSRLRETLKLLQPVIPKKTNLPVLKNILLKDGQAVANNLEVTVVLDFPEAQGGILIPHHSVQELLNFVPGNEPLTIKQKGERVELSWDGGKSSYDVADPEDYPPVTKVEKPKIAVTIEGDRLVPTMMAMVAYCATEESRVTLTGVSLRLGINTEVAAADGFRLVYQTLPVASPMEDNMIIPASSIKILDGLWRKVPPVMPLQETLVQQVVAKRHINLTRGDGILVASFGHVTLITRLIQGEFPTYKTLIPQEPPIHVRVFAPDLERAVRGIKEIAEDSNNKVYLECADDCLTVSASSAEKGEAERKVPVQVDGGSGNTAINVSYLLEYLKGKEGLVSIGITTAQSPVLLRHGTSPLVLMMPFLNTSKK